MPQLQILTAEQQASFEDECFRNWLNRVDARVEYDVRRALGSVSTWRSAFDLGQSEADAITDLQYARDNSAFCGE